MPCAVSEGEREGFQVLDVLESDGQAYCSFAYSRCRQSRLVHAEMGGACGVNHQGLCVSDIRKVCKETQSIHKGNAGVASSLDLKGKHSASAFGE